MEIKYLRKVLTEVDKDVRVPDSVRGAALRAKLDNVKPGTYWPEMLRTLLSRRPGSRSWQAGLAYAASFAVIIALGSLIAVTNKQPQLIDGRMQVLTQSDEADMDDGSTAALDAVRADADTQENDTPVGEVTQFSAPEQEQPPAQPSSAADSPETGGEVLGVGGAGKAHALAMVEGYSYTWRANDQNDPDKQDIPVTVEIIDDETHRLMAQIDLADITSVEACYIYAEKDVLVLIGAGEDGAGMVLRTYDITDKSGPAEVAVVEQPGFYLGSQLYEGRVRLATRFHGALDLEEQEELPGSTGDAHCVLTTLDAATGEASTMAFTGADGVVDLQEDGGVRLTYTVEGDEDGEEDVLTAVIRTNGTKMTLDSVE